MVETARRREIEDVASTLFRERGYAGTSVRDIARAMDIQGASLYAHVASKQDVLRAIVERMASRFEHAAQDALKAIDGEDAEATPTARLAALTRAHVEVVTDDLGARRSSSTSGVRSNPICGPGWRRRRDAYERRFRSVIADGVDSGEFATVDPAAAAAFILTALNGLVAWYRPDGRLEPAAIADLYHRPGGPCGRRDGRAGAMTDPLALDPILGPTERAGLPFNDADLSHDERFEASRRTSSPAARSSPPTGCRTSTGRPSCASSRCTPTAS